MQIINTINDITPTDYKITNPYAIGCNVRTVKYHQSTSADGWKYYKRNKRKES